MTKVLLRIGCVFMCLSLCGLVAQIVCSINCTWQREYAGWDWWNRMQVSANMASIGLIGIGAISLMLAALRTVTASKP